VAKKNYYTVKAGDNLAKIAESIYGDQRFLALLLSANGGSSLIHPGDVLYIPNVPKGVEPNAAPGSGKQLNISPDYWSYIQGQDQAFGFTGGQQAQPQTNFPDPSVYNSPSVTAPQTTANQAGVPGAGVLTGPAVEQIPGYGNKNYFPPQDLFPGAEPTLNINVPDIDYSVTPVGITGPAALGAANPPGPTKQQLSGPTQMSVPVLNLPNNPYGALGQGVSGAQLAGLIDSQLDNAKPEGTYSVPRSAYTQQAYESGGSGPQYTQGVGSYTNVPVSGGKPGAYLLWDRIAQMSGQPWKQIGGGEDYPDLALPWTEWAGKWLPYPTERESAPAYGGGGGGGYYGGYGGGGGGGYTPPSFTRPQTRRGEQLAVGPGRTRFPSRGSGTPFFGGGSRQPGINGARQGGVVALTTWTL